MIAWLKGTVVHIGESEIVLNCNNVGYCVQTGSNLPHLLRLKIGEERELAVYTFVKEGELRLFGFESFPARRMFSVLLTVNGVGPKAAMNIVDQISPGEIVASIRQNSFEPFLRVSGIGKKTAQRIVLDLQGKMQAWEAAENGGEHTQTQADSQTGRDDRMELVEDAKSALINLGFSEREARRTIGRHLTDEMNFNTLIRSCLNDLHNTA